MTPPSMFEHIDDWMMDLALGTALGSELVAIEAHLAGCDRCTVELAATREAIGAFALVLPAVAPAPAVRERLLAAATGTSRFAPFLRRLSEMVHLALDQTEALVARLDDPASWVPGPVPGISLLHFQGGPGLERAITGFVRLERGAVFPHHKHIGAETVFILEGSCRHDDGSIARRGDVVPASTGSEHEVTALEDLTYAAVVFEGIEVGGQAMRYDDPRY